MKESILEHKKTLLVLFIIIIFLGFVTYQFVSVSGVFSDLKNDLKEIEPEEGSSYQNLDGESVNLKDYKGSVLVINSWATWSPYSKDELKTLTEVKNQFEEDVAVIAINRKENPALVRAYLNTYNISDTAIEYLIDPSDYFYTASGGYAMPETILYKKDGSISVHYRGTLDKEALVQAVERLLE